MHEQLPKTDPSKWVSEHGGALYAYALSKLKHADAAEDAVQEALLGGLKNLKSSPPTSDVGPWLMGILKKKVVDRQRISMREETKLVAVDSIVDQLFDKSGKWSKVARAADQFRLDSLEQSEFAGILKRCLQGLTPTQSAVFVGREINERNPEDLCKELGVSSTNFWVLMHRARLRLAECIRVRWAMEAR